MGYGDWTELEIKNKSGKELSLRNCQHEWGKFYFCESGSDKNREISIDELNSKKIAPGGSYRFGACGKENSLSGCDGFVELWDAETNVMAAKVRYFSPHGTSYNRMDIDCPNEGWNCSQTGGYLGNDQPLGNVKVTVSTY
ncbi:hypothetical protein SMACR_02177 [Sordaria macrospora]|uniref:WGS project CABT00000000 data, contig 2.18 n=2 Tax=Sordaria macrospora TaxID=5147 RepID=F7W167_SORMK|nr:uncharacterized protein SMAC_02177 [Sordaria macrospora k-hell]KAA8633329.1 hypothetical protein SMACR_02177 [Sordaria macrospora]KAH7629124.1 aegerolysin type hemolysin [Sordaria sp. MPI-SDFR-AT-0083]WPJ63736.1 hypothetical protein SMAC4_02177 [Sordaria macrospora]CCC11519.1 unnamed protein product [Sordaria macrospora k-hell]